MTQQQHIRLLQDIAPDIAATGDPEAVMLKAAHKHNLSPAQFTKLGHVYNTAKSLLVFEKSANRGDSFSLVDVPAMVQKYTTFDPTKTAGYNGEDAYSQFASILDDADKDVSQEWNYWAGSMNSVSRQPDNTDLNDIVRSMWKPGVEFENAAHGRANIELPIDGYVTQPDIVHEKAASVQEDDILFEEREKLAHMDEFERNEYSKRMHKRAEQECVHAMNVVQDYSKGLADSFVHEIRDEKSDWKEIAYDLHDGLGVKKAAEVIELLQEYFKEAHLRVPQVNIEERGYQRAFAQDRFGLLDKAAELLECNEMYKMAEAQLEKLRAAKPAVKEAGNKLTDIPTDIADSFGVLNPSDTKKLKEEALNKAKTHSTIEQLMLSDPVIGQADPSQVEDLYATISNLCPTVAKDPVTMGPVMKEALQYGSLPVQSIKDLLEIEHSQQRINKANKEIDTIGDYDN